MSAPPTPPSRWLLPALALAQLMLVLDVTVANVALPDIAAALDLGRQATPWVITVYALMLGGFMLVGGRAADVFGPRRVLLAGLTTFTGASLLAASAWDASTLLEARALQGLGAAFLSPAALAAITTTFTGQSRLRALGLWAAVGGAGASVGVLVGGLLTSGPGWRWIFLINVPVGVLVLTAVVRMVPRARPGSASALDVIGGVLVTAGTAGVIFSLTRIGQDGSLTLATGLVLVAAMLLFGLFALRERVTAQPLVDLTVFAKPRVTTGSAIMLAASGLLVGMFFILSFYFQQQLGWSALRTGIAFLPLAVGTVAGAQSASHAVSAQGPRVVGAAAFLVTGLGLGLASWGVATTWLLISAISFAAVGIGAAFVTATTTALGDADHAQAGVVSGVVNTFHELGSALGVAAVSGLVTVGGFGAASVSGADIELGLRVAAGVAFALAGVGAIAIPRGKPAPGSARFMH